jgi:hypothetical protein
MKNNSGLCYNNNYVNIPYKGAFLMKTKDQIEQEILELKMDYINLQGDMEKLESLGHEGSVKGALERLEKMEARLAELNKQLASM